MTQPTERTLFLLGNAAIAHGAARAGAGFACATISLFEPSDS